jgi:anti-sigma regulatory factor (Ser/Thr protein kinase)
MTDDGRRFRLREVVAPSLLDRGHAWLADVWAAAPDVGADERPRLERALAEVLAHQLEHAGAAGRTADLEVVVTPAAVEATVVAPGPPIPPPTGTMPEADAEAGRGYPLLAELLDDLSSDRVDGGNRLVLLVRRPG